METNQHRLRLILSNILFLSSGILIITGIISYNIKAIPWFVKHCDIPLSIKNIYNYSIWIGLSMLFYGLGLNEKNKLKKYLYYYNLSYFFILYFSTYLFDYNLDFMVETTIVINCLIITTLICLIYYLYLVLNKLIFRG